MSTKTDTLTAIAFLTMIAHTPNVKEIHTYKTAKGRFELYAIVGQFQGSGFALGYLILDAHKDIELTKMTILTEFFNHIQNLGFGFGFGFGFGLGLGLGLGLGFGLGLGLGLG